MSTSATLRERSDSETSRPTQQFSDQLRQSTLAIRLSFTWFGVHKTLSAEQKAQAAESFGASGAYLSAGKKLFDTSEPSFRAVTSIRNAVVSFLKATSLPFPEPGIRLIRRCDLDGLTERLQTWQAELQDAVEVLDSRLHELKQAARQRLGDLYSDTDYPHSLAGEFQMMWEFPSVEPPQYLQQLNPELYRQECRRVQERFDTAVRLAEAAFIEELSRLVDHLAERLSGADDGKPKIFRDSAVQNLTEFFERFQHLSIGSDDQLDDLVQRSQQILQGVVPQQLRDNQGLRQQIAGQLSGVQSALEGLLVDRPRRSLLRPGNRRGSDS